METMERWIQAAKELAAGIEFENPIIGLGAALLVALFGLVLYRIVSLISRRAVARIEAWQGTRIKALRVQQQEILSADEIANLATIIVKAVRWVLLVAIVVVACGLILGFFTWTRHIATSGLDLAIGTLIEAGRAVIAYIPNLMLVVVIAAVAMYLIRLLRLVFNGIHSERIRLRRFYPEWAMPTFNIVRILICVFALVMAFPYLPGAGSPAFRGVSIFVGVLFSLGSTSAVANLVAGIVITYMRAFKLGDRVSIADTEGIVIERSLFVTRLRTPKNVEIAVPNSKVLANHIVNFSALARTKGLFLHTTVGIGYDVDWRTVHELMLAAAHDTDGVVEDPEPFVQQVRLGDYAVDYELNAAIHRPHRFSAITSDLHANILDRFHEAGVEIMSPAFAALRDGSGAAVPKAED